MKLGRVSVISHPCVMKVGGIEVFILPDWVQQPKLVYTPGDGFLLKVPHMISERRSRLFLKSQLPWMRQQLHETQVHEDVSKMRFDGYPIKVKFQNRKSMKAQFVDDKYIQVFMPYDHTADDVARLLSGNSEKMFDVIRCTKERNRQAAAATPEFVDGEKVNLMGQEFTLHYREEPTSDAIHLYIDGYDWTVVTPKVLSFEQRRLAFKKIAERQFELVAKTRYDYWLGQMGFMCRPDLYFSDMRSRWGVCYPSRFRVGLSRQLLYHSVGALDTTIVHELCHFEESNHSPAFYALMAKYKPDYEVYRKELKQPITWRF